MRSGLPGPKNPKSSAMKTTTWHCSKLTPVFVTPVLCLGCFSYIVKAKIGKNPKTKAPLKKKGVGGLPKIARDNRLPVQFIDTKIDKRVPGAVDPGVVIYLFPHRSPSPRPHPTPRNGPETDPKRTRNGAKRSRNGAETESKPSLSGWDGRGVCRG